MEQHEISVKLESAVSKCIDCAFYEKNCLLPGGSGNERVMMAGKLYLYSVNARQRRG